MNIRNEESNNHKCSLNLIIRRRHLHLIWIANVKPAVRLMFSEDMQQCVICLPMWLYLSCSTAKWFSYCLIGTGPSVLIDPGNEKWNPLSLNKAAQVHSLVFILWCVLLCLLVCQYIRELLRLVNHTVFTAPPEKWYDYRPKLAPCGHSNFSMPMLWVDGLGERKGAHFEKSFHKRTEVC